MSNLRHGLALFLAFVAVFGSTFSGTVSMVISAPATPVSSLYIALTKQPESKVLEYLESIEDEPFNYDHPGSTDQQYSEIGEIKIPSGYRINYCTAKIGAGKHAYERAIKAIKSGENVNRLGWAGLTFPEKDPQKWAPKKPRQFGKMVATQAFSYCAWSVNPCRVVYATWDSSTKDGGLCSMYGYATVKGHLLSGEESFRVRWDGDKGKGGGGAVHYDMLSFSRGSGPLGALAAPFVRPIQKKFFREQIKIMKAMVGADAGQEEVKEEEQ
mmetsp:Transcript_20568/g.35439  ORF Transcript_20568/g.35439 Transcript_20568/m.35439 type:complete len:270 (-) Transcript_20568:342-1151(-)